MIASTEHLTILACLMFLVVGSLLFEQTKAGKLFPAAICMLLGAIVLSNIGILPYQAPVYGKIAELAVPIAVFLLLLRANIREILYSTGSVLRLFLIGAGATVVGVIVTYYLLPVPDGGRAAAIFVGMMIGGTPNEVAIAQAVEIDATLFSALLAASVFTSTLYLMILAILGRSATMQRFLPGRSQRLQDNVVVPAICDRAVDTGASGIITSPTVVATKFSALNIAILAAGGIGSFVFVRYGLELIGQEKYLISAVTFVSLIFANVFPKSINMLTGDREIAMVILLLFFGTIGVRVDLARFGSDTVMYALFFCTVALIHLIIVFGISKLMKEELQEMLIGSVAGIGGPSSTAAMAATYNRADLITPGILCALLGYAIATFVGLGLYEFVFQ